MTDERKTLEQAVEEFSATWHAVVDPTLLRWLRWLDRQLRRWPWLYRRLGGQA